MNKIVKLIAKPFNLCISSVSPSCFGRWTNISFVLTLTAFLLVGIPAGAKSSTIVSSQSTVVAVADTSMVAYIEKKTGIQIPAEYRNKIDSIFKDNYPHIKVEIDGINSWEFTVDYVLNEMKSDWSISKDNQLLFILDSFSELLSGEGVYDGEDGDSIRWEEYEKAFDNIDVCRDRYKEGIMPFIEKQKAEYRRQSAEARQQSAEARQQSAEARQQSAEARQQSAEARQQSAEATKKIMQQDSIWIKERMTEFHDVYKQNPANIKHNDLEFMIKSTKEFISDCKERNIDYKAILRKELGDDKKVKDLLKFYGIEE